MGQGRCRLGVIEIGVLRELFRNLQSWKSSVEAREVDETILGPDNQEYNVYDIEYLYSQRTLLSPRQRQAIELCLYENYKEKEAARIMGVSITNPVAMYATDGLKKLCDLIEAGELTRYSEREYADRGIGA